MKLVCVMQAAAGASIQGRPSGGDICERSTLRNSGRAPSSTAAAWPRPSRRCPHAAPLLLAHLHRHAAPAQLQLVRSCGAPPCRAAVCCKRYHHTSWSIHTLLRQQSTRTIPQPEEPGGSCWIQLRNRCWMLVHHRLLPGLSTTRPPSKQPPFQHLPPSHLLILSRARSLTRVSSGRSTRPTLKNWPSFSRAMRASNMSSSPCAQHTSG
jgi:hypothetical protein